MSGASLNLAALQALITLGGYGGRGTNEPSSAVVGLSAAFFLSDLSIWQGVGDKLTSAEIDDIEELVAQLEYDLMVTDDMYPQDRCQLTFNADVTTTHAVLKTLAFDKEIYDPEGMHSIIASKYKINVLNDGLHLIDVNWVWEGNPIGIRRVVVTKYDAILTSTATIAIQNIAATGNNEVLSQQISVQDYGSPGDYYFANAYQNSGGDLDIDVSQTLSIISVVRL